MLAPSKIFRVLGNGFDLREHLENSRLFSSLPPDEIRAIGDECVIRQLPDRSPIPANESQSVHLLIRGKAKVCYLTDEGKQPILYFVSEDELIGEQAILTGTQNDDYIETIEPAVVASIPTRKLRRLILSEPVFATSLSELIARRRTIVENRMRHLLFLSNRERLTHLLLDLAEQYGQTTGAQTDLHVKLSHQDLANFIGSTRETVTVVLGKMQSEGLLVVKRRRVTLLDTRTLARSVNREPSANLRHNASA